MRVCDVYCGFGGFAAGAQAAGATPVFGVDADDAAVRYWAANNADGAGCLASLWPGEGVAWPAPAPDLHVHLSPPCTLLSSASWQHRVRASKRARRGEEGGEAKGEEEGDDGDALDGIRAALAFVLERGDASWSIENVSTPATRACLEEYARAHPTRVAHCTLDAAEFGVPSSRVRLLVGPPALVRRLRQTAVRRISVREAFAREGRALPAPFLKNSARRLGKPCVRSVDGPAHTVVASRPLAWCDADGATVRCVTAAETAILMGFPRDWVLPTKSRVALRAVGNAVPPPLARAIMAAAM